MNIYTISFLVILVFNIIKNKKSLHMLQQNLYNENNRYMKWIKRNFKSVFVTLDFISLIILLFAYLLNNNLSNILIIITLIIYVLEIMRILNNRKLEQVKKPLVITKRVRRLIFTISILFVLPIIIYLLNHKSNLLIQ